MKTEITVDEAAGTVRVELTIDNPENVAKAVEMVKRAASMLFPGEVSTAQEAASKDGRKSHTLKWPPAIGSMVERVYDAAVRLKTTKPVAIADDLDLTTSVAAMMLAKLRKAGKLELIK